MSSRPLLRAALLLPLLIARSPPSPRGVRAEYSAGDAKKEAGGGGGGGGGEKRVAIIGGGISGSFAAKYLSDLDAGCSVGAVDVYDPSPVSGDGAPTAAGVPSAGEAGGGGDDHWQGSRVSSLTLSDGTVVEIGASIVYDGNRLVVEMMEGDPDLVAGRPMTPGRAKEEAEAEAGRDRRQGFGIYDGEGKWLMRASDKKSWARKLRILGRYNVDLMRMDRAASRALKSFDLIYELLDSNNPSSFLESPDELWDAVGLLAPTQVSFDEFLDALGVCRDLPWWRSLLPYQGCIRTELLTAANINNYNQDNRRMNGLAGLVSFVPTKGKLFSVQGGNHQLITSAFNQAKRNREMACGADSISKLRHLRKQITTVVSDIERGVELFSGEESLGWYDIVVLAAPLQHAGVSFLVRSHHDGAVLYPMPLGGSGRGDAVEGGGEDPADDERRRIAPPGLPSSATRQYTQVVTTVISGGELQQENFHLSRSDDLPRSIYLSERGRELEGGLTTVTQLTSDGVFKTFSSERMPAETLGKMFGPSHRVEHVKVWGGERGGATPDFGGGGEASVSTPFLLYDGAMGVEGRGDGPALFYVNAIEAAVSAIEIEAIGAKSVAKLVARRLGLIETSPTMIDGEL